MADLLLAFDPGSSLSKALYTTYPFQLELMVMEPEVFRVDQESIELYEQNRIGQSSPENSAWIEWLGEYRAVGYLAKTRFHGTAGLKELKFGRALYKLLAIVGAIAQKKLLPSKFSMSLGLLLPWGEYQDRERFKRLASEALANFSFRGQRYAISLEGFDCMPEGAGLLLRGRQSNTSLRQESIAVIMIGYRNASALVWERGAMTCGNTSNLGFIRLIEKVQEFTSGQNPDALAAAIYQAGPKIKPKAFRHLVQTTDPRLQDEEIAQIVQAVKTFRAEHWQMLKSWQQEVVPAGITEVILGGGTATYYRPELNRFYPNAAIAWCEQLEKRVEAAFGGRAENHCLDYRLTDVYGYFFYLLSQQQQEKRQEEQISV